MAPPSRLDVKSVVGLVVVHTMGFVAALFFQHTWVWDTALIMVQLALLAFVGLASTAGFHRLFVHESYEAATPLQLFFLVFGTAGLTGSAIGWIRTHRTHHKHSDTDLDPHNRRLGFWHSHFGWMLRDLPSEILEERDAQCVATLPNQWLHEVFDRHQIPLGLLTAFALPCIILPCVGGANAAGIFWTTWLRICVGMNMAASVNSLAHTFGERPVDSSIEARDNFLVSVFTWGEGWHNAHHAHPKDFRASSHDDFVTYWNPAQALILLTARLGLAWNLKVACGADDAERAVSINGAHYKYRFHRVAVAAEREPVPRAKGAARHRSSRF